MSERITPIATRFWSKVDFSQPDGCWLWTGSRRHTYGEVFRNGAKMYAHRAAYELTYGQLAPGQVVCHHCDTPLCVRPDHLFSGTQVDNIIDMRQKQRGKNPPRFTGEEHAQAKLTDAQAAEICRRYANGGIKQRDLATEYGVAQGTISRITRGARRTG